MPLLIDGQSKTIRLDAEAEQYTAKEIYSRWKQWVRQGDNAKWSAAFRVVGGDDLGDSIAPAFYFVRNDRGWSIKRPEASIQVEIVGNLVFENPDGIHFSGPDGEFSPVIDVRLSDVATTDLQVVLDAIKAAMPDDMQKWLWRLYVAHYHKRTHSNAKTTLFDSVGTEPLFEFDHSDDQISPKFDPEAE